MTKKTALSGATVMATLLVLFVIWQFRTIAIYLLISLMFAAALRPLSYRIARLTTLLRTVWIILYVLLLAAFGAFLFLTGERAVQEIEVLAQTLSVQDMWRLPIWLEGSPFQQALIARLPVPSMLFTAMTGDEGQLVLPALLGFSQSLGVILSGGLIILILSIYWAGNQIHFERLWLSMLPPDQRKQIRGTWRTVETELGAYLRCEAIMSLLAGLALSLGYWLLGSPFPVLLAVTGALATLVPMIGLVLAVIPVLLVGLLSGVQLSLFTTIFTVVILIALTAFMKPHILNPKRDHPMLTIFLVIAFGGAFGFAGIIAAPPVSVVSVILWDAVISHRFVAGAATRMSDLKERQTRVWDTIQEMEEPPPALVASSMERLTDLIEQAESVLQVTFPAGIASTNNGGRTARVRK